MFDTYENYCAMMKKHGAKPLSQEIWKREYAPKEEEHVPLMIRPKNQRPHEPKIELHNG